MPDAVPNPASAVSRPDLTLLLGAAGSGKTAQCLRRFEAAGGKALYIVPSSGHAERARRALGLEGRTASRITTFGALASDLAGVPADRRRGRSFQRLALAGICAREIAETDYFGRVRSMPGFPAALAEAIRDLKLAGITPEALALAAEAAGPHADDPAFTAKTGEMARLYAAYQRLLAANGLCDEDDLPGLAAARVARGAMADVPVVLMDGFYRLSRAWRELMAAFARRGAQVIVTLLHEPSRPLLFTTSARTLDTLRAEFTTHETQLGRQPNNRPETLQSLEHNLFAGETRDESSELTEKPAPAHDSRLTTHDSLRIFDAPNPYAEVEMVARELRREHDERQTPWNRCALILRSVAQYAPVLEAVAEKYDVPLALQQAIPVAGNPLIRALLTLLDIFRRDWQREDVIAFLKSSYTPADKLGADLLRARASRRGLREGRAGWERFAAGLGERDEEMASTLQRMLAWDERLRERARTIPEWAAELDEMRLTFDLRPRAEKDPAVRALEQARHVLAEMVRLAEMVGREEVTLEEFTRELAGAWRAASYAPDSHEDAVAVIEPFDARQVAPVFTAVMGLTERVFPPRTKEDPFLRDDERALVAREANLALEEQRERADDERLLFYLAVTAPSARLVLSFPRSDDEADTLPSFYLDEVRAVFDHVPTVTRTLADVAPRPEECVTERDRLLASCAEAEDAPGADNPVRATRHRPRLPRLEEMESQRAFSAPRRYTVTQIEEYNRCPFQYLMEHGLGVRPESDGAGSADKGTLLHNTLRNYFRKRMRRDERPSAEEMRAALKQELEACLAERAIDARPHRRQMMARSLSDALDGFATREERYATAFGLAPSHFELAFGHPEPEPGEGELARDYDPASTEKPLVIQDGDGRAIEMCGVIDRVDLASDERRALVVDYKLGSAATFADIKGGRSVQMPLYLLALEQLWEKTGAAACYDSPRDNGRRRFFRTEHAEIKRFGMLAGVEAGVEVKPVGRDEYEETIEAARQAVRAAVAGIAACAVGPTPGEYCAYCAYGDICRTARDGTHDGEGAL